MTEFSLPPDTRGIAPAIFPDISTHGPLGFRKVNYPRSAWSGIVLVPSAPRARQLPFRSAINRRLQVCATIGAERQRVRDDNRSPSVFLTPGFLFLSLSLIKWLAEDPVSLVTLYFLSFFAR